MRRRILDPPVSPANFRRVIEVVRKCTVNVGKGSGGDAGNDFIRSHPVVLLQDDDVLYSNAMVSDVGSPAKRFRRFYDAFIWDDTHGESLA